MEMICLQCGDVGFPNAFVHCVRCLDVAVHRYCLDVIPKTYDEFVHWVCDDCHMKVRKAPIVCESGMKKNDTMVLKIEELSCEGEPSQSSYCSPTLEWAESFNKRSCPEELRVDDELVDEGILKDKRRVATFSARVKGMHRFGNNFYKRRSERPSVNNCHSTVLSKTKDWRKFCLEPRKSDRKAHTAKHRGLSKNKDAHRNSQKKKPVPSQKKKKPVPSSENIRLENKQLTLENCCSDMTTFEASIDPSNDHTEITRPEISEKKTYAPNDMSDFCERSSEDCKIPSMVGCSVLAEPVLEPIWRGNFNIWNTNEGVEGLMAHMSNLACQKVYDEACQLPVVLELEIRPKSDVWPKSFEKSDPSGEHIALYFFPSEISERDYDVLVDEMVSEELGMRAILPDAELLVFTSTELPLPYWRFKHKYYLWGVFRGKQLQKDNVLCKQESTTKSSQKSLASEPGCNSSRVPVKTKWHGSGRSLISLSNSCSSNGSGACSSNVVSF